MSDGASEFEPSPFDDDEPAVHRAKAWEPLDPLTQEDLDLIAARPANLRTFNPWACAWNLNAEDGIGYMSGLGYRQCSVQVADPTKSRYCLKHARTLGVDYYSPQETSEITDREVAGALTRIVPKAVETLEDVMDDMDAPAGIRAKAAADVLDRTGYSKGVDVRVDAKVAVYDVTSIISDRLDALREAQQKGTAAITGIPEVEVVSGEVVEPTGEDGADGADGADGE